MAQHPEIWRFTMKLVINRKQWLRGEGACFSRLLRGPDGKMCCVGCYAIALGAKPADIMGLDMIDELPSICPDWGYTRYGNNDINNLYANNDSVNISEERREAVIKKIFARHDVEVEFVG
jgi:hypothetical protein